MNFAEKIFETLSQNGVSYCCAVPGGGIMYLIDAVGRHKGFRTRFFHHEQAAGFAAEASARVNGQPAVCLVTIGPGAVNAVAAAFSCFVNSVPCLFISGAKRSSFQTDYKRERFTFPQDGDTEHITSPVVKAYHKLNTGDDVTQLIPDLLALSSDGRPGPVWLDIPLDVQASDTEASSSAMGRAKSRVTVDAPRLEKFILESERPIFLIGRGCESIFRTEAYQHFLSQSKLPFVTSIGSNHLLKNAGDMALGFFGPTGRRAANRVLTEADAIIAIGSGLDIDSTGFDRNLFFQGKRILTINSDPWLVISEAKHWVKICAPVQALDLSVLSNLLVRHQSRYKRWRQFCQSVNTLLSIDREIEQNLTHNGVDPYLFCRRLSQLAPDNTGFAGGISLDVHAFSHVAELHGNQEFYLSPHAGQLGWDIPAAIGISDSARFDTIVCLTGDGSAMFNIQELATLRGQQTNIVVIIFDNDGYNSIRSTQDTHLHGRRIGSTLSDLAFPKWENLASSFGYHYLEIRKNCEIDNIATTMRGQHWLVRVKLDPERSRTPRLISKIKNGDFVSPNIYNQFPDLPSSVEVTYAALKKDLWD